MSNNRKTSGLKLPGVPLSAETKPPEPETPDCLHAGRSNFSEATSPNQETPDGKQGSEAGVAKTEGSKVGVETEQGSTEVNTLDGMGIVSDLTRLKGMNNPLEVVKWTYLSPALEKERSSKDIHSEEFWSTGKAPKPRDLEREKELAKLILPKPGDKDYCVLKYGNIPSPIPEYCIEHGWVSGPGSTEPSLKPELPEKVVKRLEMVGVDKTSLAQCDTHGHLKINIFVEAEVVETFDKWDVRKDDINLPCGYGHQPLRWLGQAACIRVAFLKNEPSSKFLPLAVKSADGIVLDPEMPIRDVLTTGDKIIIDYSSGPSTFREPWLGRAALPTPNALIKEFFEGLPKGPVVVDVPPPKLPPPKKKKKKKAEAAPLPPAVDPENPSTPPPPQLLDREVQTPVDIVSFLDWPAYDIPAMLSKVMPDLDETARETEFMVVQEIMRAFSGAMQAIILWFSGQGKELEDKDFGLLYLVGEDRINHKYLSGPPTAVAEQYLNLFKVLKLCPEPFTESKLTWYFIKYVPVNNIKASYQLSSWGFFPVLLHLASDLYHEAGSEARYHEKIYHFIVDDLLPNFSAEIKSTVEDMHSAETAETAEALKEREETAKAALRVAIPEYTETQPAPVSMDPNVPTPGVPDLSTPERKAAAFEEAVKKAEEEEVKKKVTKDKEVAEAIVFANAWAQVDMEVDAKTIMPHFKKWLALGERWDDFMAAGVIIYALQAPLDVMDFAVKTATLRFGLQEIQRFLLAASHSIYRRTPLLRVSEHSFLRSYMQNVFVRAKVAQPLYSTYEEKLEYLRKHCFRHEEPLPKLPEKKKGYS